LATKILFIWPNTVESLLISCNFLLLIEVDIAVGLAAEKHKPQYKFSVGKRLEN